MKIFIFFWCFTAFSFNTTPVLSQNAKVKINQDKTLTVDQVFDLIMTQTNYRFIYEEGIFNTSPKVSLKKGIIKVNSLLEKSLSNGNYDFKLAKKHVVVIKRKDNNFETKTKTQTQTQEMLVGRVTVGSVLFLEGVNVVINKNERGVFTDFDGKYSVRVSVGDSISFSYIGFETQTFIYSNQKVLNVDLKESSASLDQIVIVSTGYQKISKERATGSFQNIEEKVLDTKVSQDIISKLEGEIAGVVFDNKGDLTIRGTSTIDNQNKDPLIVVDGFPISQGLNSINPNDIEKISVLKDAAAASIWGIRATNGVIVITTKKGTKESKPIVRFSSNIGITQKDNYNDLKYASTENFLEFEKYTVDNEWYRLPTTEKNQFPLSKGLETYLNLEAGKISQAQADKIINSLKGIDNRKEFSDLFMGASIWKQHNLSVSGGGTYNTYRASITYNSNENQDFFKNNDRDEIIANFNNSIQITPKLTLNTGINYNVFTTKRNGLSFSDYEDIRQYQEVLDANGNYLPQVQTIYQDYKEQKVKEGYPYNWNYNLKQEFDEKNNVNKETAIRIQAGLNYEITDYLALEAKYQYERGQSNVENLFNENTYYTRDLVNTFTYFDTTENTLVSSIPKGSVIEQQFRETLAHNARFQFNLDKSFNEGKHQINTIGGYEIRQVKEKFKSGREFGYDPQSLTFAQIAYGQSYTVTPSIDPVVFDNPASFNFIENRFISYYGNTSYTYNKKYTVSGSVRLDDANLFGGSEKYRNIPLYSIGAKWDLHKENFLNNNDIVNKLSLRATYGSNGNVDTSTSPFLQARNLRDFNTGNPYAYVSNVKNPFLRLEKTFVKNLGLDFSLLNNRIYGSVEYYERKSEDLLAPISVNTTLGFNKALLNVGEIENKGIDIQLNGKVINTNNFKYLTRVNFSFNENKVTFVETPNENVSTYLSGEPLLNTPLNYLYSYKYAGLDAEGFPRAYNENGEIIDKDGNMLDGTSAEITNVAALEYNGTTTPKYYGAWINNFEYKKFSLRILTTFKLGHVFKNTNVLKFSSITPLGNFKHIHSDYAKTWKKPGDENITDVPRLASGLGDAASIGYSYYEFGNHLIDSASHIRLKEIILGYQIDNKFLQNTGFSQLGLSLQASNIGVINFNKWNIDSESLLLPIRPTYTFNITATF